MNQEQHDAIRKLSADIASIRQLIIDLEDDVDKLFLLKETDNGNSN